MLAVLEKYRKIDTLGNPKSFLLGIASGKITIIKMTNKCLRRHCTKQMNCGTRLNIKWENCSGL
jgi:hypothetical protein